MKPFKFLAIPLLFLSLVVFGQGSVTKLISDQGWKLLDETDYSIEYPDNWELNNDKSRGINFYILSPQTSTADLFRENVNLIEQDLAGRSIDLDQYVEISESQIKKLISNSNLIESKRLNKNGSDYQRVIYTGDQGSYKLKFEQYYWVKNGKAYVLTLTCEITQFKEYQELGEKILNSFVLK